MVNSSIGCNVCECKHNDTAANACTLNKIQVKKNKPDAECPECTDCASFCKR